MCPMKLIGKTKQKILEEITKHPIHGYQIAHNLELPLSTVYGHLKDLQNIGLIKGKKGCPQIIYSTTEKGILLLQVIK